MSMQIERPVSTVSEYQRQRGSGPPAGREQAAEVLEQEEVKYAGLYFPVANVQDVQLAVIYRNASVSDYVWDRIEIRVEADLAALNDKIATGETTVADLVTGVSRPPRSRRNASVKKKTLAVYFPISRIQKVKTAASFNGMSMSAYVWSIIEDEVRTDLRDLGTVLIQREGTVSES